MKKRSVGSENQNNIAKEKKPAVKGNIVFKVSLISLLSILLGFSVYIGNGLWNKYLNHGEEIIPVSSDVTTEQEDFPKETYAQRDETTGIMSYGSPTMKITIEPVVRNNLRMWISIIKIKDPKQLESAFAKDEFNLNNREKTSDIAKRHGAVFAVDGAAAGFNKDSFVIRDGILYRATNMDFAPLIIKDNGDFVIFNRAEKTGEEILQMGGRHTLDFGPDLIKNGEIVSWNADWYSDAKDPRTAIGQKGPLEYVVIVADGRSKISDGISFYDLALEFKRLECEWAYALDGGGSTTLYFNGQVINEPSDWNGERAVTDILYFRD